jgi:hypothetical protein
MAVGADSARRTSGGRCYRIKKQGETSGGGSLTTQQHLSEGTGSGDGAAEEIDAGGCGRGAPAAGRFGEEG